MAEESWNEFDIHEDIPLHEGVMLPMKKVCDDLGIKIKVFQKGVQEAYFEWMYMGKKPRSFVTKSSSMVYAGVTVHPGKLLRLVNQHLTPDDLKLLVNLHQNDGTPLRGKKRDIPGYMLDYMTSDIDALQRESAVIREREDAERDRIEEARTERLNNIAAIEEKHFTYSLLDQLFWHHRGKGAGALVIGGIEVRKVLAKNVSNSGKSADFAVTFSWTSHNGDRNVLKKDSRYAGNRRNDPERNWGLPE